MKIKLRNFYFFGFFIFISLFFYLNLIFFSNNTTGFFQKSYAQALENCEKSNLELQLTEELSQLSTYELNQFIKSQM